MSWGIFWGIILVLVGLSLILKVLFNIEIPLAKFFIGFLFIYLGLKLFIGKDFTLFKNTDDKYSVVFGSKKIRNVEDGKEYNIVFGKGLIDLRTIDLNEVNDIKLNTVFGSTDIILNDTVFYRIKSTSAFAHSQLPDGNSTTFGTLFYENESDTSGDRILKIETNTVFGNTVFRKRD